MLTVMKNICITRLTVISLFTSHMVTCCKLAECYGRLNFLPPANEVWGKVIFSETSVILFTGGRSAYRGVCLLGKGSAYREDWTEPPPPESEKRAVRILLECFLIVYVYGKQLFLLHCHTEIYARNSYKRIKMVIKMTTYK